MNKLITDTKSEVILPSDYVPFIDSAKDIFCRLGKTRRMYVKGNAIVELHDGKYFEIVTPEALRSRLEELGPTVKHRLLREKVVKGESRCSVDMAKALLATEYARTLLPSIRIITRAPVVILQEGKARLLGPGYHPETGGIYVAGGEQSETPSLETAVRSICDSLAEFDFISPGDQSRAVAALLTPAFSIGKLINGPFPIDVAEADQSQSGKTYRQKITRAIYNEKAFAVVNRNGGVGGLDESLSAAFVSGAPFIVLDNFRGQLDSQFLEMAVTWDEAIPARIPYRGEVRVDASGVTFQLSSNNVVTTRDFANRSLITRIRKRENNYIFKNYPEGDLLRHVMANQGFYLSCIHVVVQHWIERGCLRSKAIDHDFFEWGCTLDWIIQHVFGMESLMSGHEMAKVRVSSPKLIWLRQVGLAVLQQNLVGRPLKATKIWEICDEENIEMPGGRGVLDEGAGRKRIGQIMSQLFRDSKGDVLELGDLVVRRFEVSEYSNEHRKELNARYYVVGRSLEDISRDQECGEEVHAATCDQLRPVF